MNLPPLPRDVVLVGTEPGALLAGMMIAFALEDETAEHKLAHLGADPLLPPLRQALRGTRYEESITEVERIPECAIAIGSSAFLERRHELPITSRLALLALGAEPAWGRDPERARAQLTTALAQDELEHLTLVRPFDPIVRRWQELVETVHHSVGPAAQEPLVDSIRAALFGKHGAIAVDLRARVTKPQISVETATILLAQKRTPTLSPHPGLTPSRIRLVYRPFPG